MDNHNIAPAIHERKGHTQGEWFAEKPDMFGDYNICRRDTVEDGTDCRAIAAVVSNMRPFEEVAANACLIAEAPKLLAHLKFAVALLTPLIGGTAQVEAMRAAIAKAEG